MASNSFGELFRITTFGESHGPMLGVVIDGAPPGFALDLVAVERELARRRPGQSPVTSARREPERLEVLAGLYEGRTTGAPLTLAVRNADARPGDYDALAHVFRPGHADFTYARKYGLRDHRGGGRSSGRETVARVAAGAVAKQLLAQEGVRVVGSVIRIGDVVAEDYDEATIEDNPVRSGDRAAAQRMVAAIEAARADGDSLGGIVEVRALGVPVGLGDPVFGKLDARLAAALVSIGAVKGVEIGDGFALATMRGSESNDALGRDGFVTNHMGGILGGISSGAPVVVRVAVKPTPSIQKTQQTVDENGAERSLAIGGRHDPCICPRIVPVAEAMVALVLYDALCADRALCGRGPRT